MPNLPNGTDAVEGWVELSGSEEDGSLLSEPLSVFVTGFGGVSGFIGVAGGGEIGLSTEDVVLAGAGLGAGALVGTGTGLGATGLGASGFVPGAGSGGRSVTRGPDEVLEFVVGLLTGLGLSGSLLDFGVGLDSGALAVVVSTGTALSTGVSALCNEVSILPTRIPARKQIKPNSISTEMPITN
jgi:hypothetical protein